MLSAARVVVGSSALGTACRRRTSHVAQALGARGDQVVLAELVEQRRPHDQRVLREVGEGERDHRQGEVPGGVEHPAEARRIGVDGVQPTGREDARQRADADREPGDEQQAQPPLRHGVERERGAGRELVEAPAAPPRAHHAEVDPDQRRQDRREPDERDRRPHPVDDQLGDRHVVADGDAQVALGGVLRGRSGTAAAAAGRARTARGTRRAAPCLTTRPRVRLRAGSPGSTRNRKKLTTSTKQQAPERAQRLAEDVAPVAPPAGRGLGGRPRARTRRASSTDHSRASAVVRRRIATTPPPTTSSAEGHAAHDQHGVAAVVVAHRRPRTTRPRSPTRCRRSRRPRRPGGAACS